MKHNNKFMRSRFRETLQGKYKDVAEEAIDLQELKGLGEDIIESFEELEHVFNFTVRKTVEARGSNELAQADILSIQMKKQQVMRELKENIMALNEGKETENKEAAPDSYKITQKDGIFVRVEEDGKEHRITKGEILVDGVWGLKYNLDPETMPRNLQKRYLIEEAKRKLQDYLDEQIIIDEISNKDTDSGRKDAYAGMLKAKRTGRYEMARGFVAERLVKNFFKKLCYDIGLSVKIIETDAFQDVEQKIDFIMHKFHYRGVGVEEAKGGNKGIQFTVNDTKENLRVKRRQIRKAKERIQHDEEQYVQDIMLVTIPMEEASNVYKEWASSGRPQGGPDKIWDWEFKKTIFEGVLKGVLSPDEITDEWRKVRQGSTRKGEVKLPEPISSASTKRPASKMKKVA